MKSTFTKIARFLKKHIVVVLIVAVLLALIVSLALIFGCSVSEPAESIDGSGTANTVPFVTEPISTDPVSTEPTGTANPNPSDPQPTEPAPTDPQPTEPTPTDPEPTDSLPTDPEPTDPQPTEHQHTYVSVGHEAPTCLEKGHDVVQCTACGDQRKWDAEDALGHAYGTWTVITPATADQDGQEQCVCSRCGDTVFRTIPKTGSAETQKTDVFTYEYQSAGRILPERDVYRAVDNSVFGDGCHVIIVDFTLNAAVEHIGYLTLRVTFVDNTGATQVFTLQIGGAQYPAENYGLVQLTINQDGSYEWFYSSHAGT